MTTLVILVLVALIAYFSGKRKGYEAGLREATQYVIEIKKK